MSCLHPEITTLMPWSSPLHISSVHAIWSHILDTPQTKLGCLIAFLTMLPHSTSIFIFGIMTSINFVTSPTSSIFTVVLSEKCFKISWWGLQQSQQSGSGLMTQRSEHIQGINDAWWETERTHLSHCCCSTCWYKSGNNISSHAARMHWWTVWSFHQRLEYYGLYISHSAEIHRTSSAFIYWCPSFYLTLPPLRNKKCQVLVSQHEIFHFLDATNNIVSVIWLLEKLTSPDLQGLFDVGNHHQWNCCRCYIEQDTRNEEL